MPKNSGIYVIIVAAGRGLRFGGDVPKQYMNLRGKPVIKRTIEAFTQISNVKKICVAIAPEHQDLYQEAIKGMDGIVQCDGGEERKDSVYNGLISLGDLNDDDVVLVHDAARPLVSLTDIETLCRVLQGEVKAATLAVPVSDTLRYAQKDILGSQNVDRSDLYMMQTPQGFHYGTLLSAHKNSTGNDYTDDTQLVSDAGVEVSIVNGSRENFKITVKEDLALAEKIITQAESYETRIGTGFDVHAFDEVNADTVRLCGVDVPHNKKLKGHSDADVGLHALTDAILGAIGEGDIGVLFPPTDNRFKDMDSGVFLEKAVALLHEKEGRIVNIDVTMMCERPKLMDYKKLMAARIAEIVQVCPSRINVKATTTEKLGFTGREEGIAAQASVSISVPVKDGDEI